MSKSKQNVVTRVRAHVYTHACAHVDTHVRDARLEGAQLVVSHNYTGHNYIWP